MLKLISILPKRVKFEFIFGGFLIFLTSIISFFIPNMISQFIKLIFDDQKQKITIEVVKGWILFNEADRDYVRNWLIGIILIQCLVVGLLSFLTTFMYVRAGERASYFYRVKLFEKINNLSLKNISDLKPESIMTKISNDVAVFWDFLVSGLRTMLKGFLMIIGGAIMSFFVNWILALIILLVVPLLFLILFAIGKISSPKIKKVQQQIEEVTKEIDENIKGASTIKTYNLEQKRLDKFNTTNAAWLKYNVSFNTTVSILYPIFFAVMNFVQIGILFWARNEVITKNATVNTLVQVNIFIDYLWIIGFGILLITMFLRFAFSARVSATRIVEILNTNADALFVEKGLNIIEDGKNIDYNINIENLNFKYYKDNPNYSLKNINLTIPYKTTLGIIGLFASGKSTLVSLLLNNYLYDEGSIKIANQEVNQINTEQLLQTVGIVYQDPMLFSGTIRSNMQWAKPDASDQEINEALKNACAYDFVYKFDDNLDHPITQGATNLSGGQKQRLSIARTLLRKPKILILDDSTSALDNITTKKVIENITNNYECTTILISQKIGALKKCEQIIVMESGQIIAQGTHEELIKNCEFYSQIHASQLEA
ncbi:ABC-type multidrug/protein/lipid transport system ATPase component [Mycoplasmopsis bovigenitalium]|uniref:ABC-type multidrug/protein/lipid transport system ATPase component n=1 Tax=Mycoplasmopsis bovigenitalium TaxID=2112 RepID=A0A449A8K2_9BACT|nr:ABC transporter ATP-binding protein [Mycoplasmopsis bovigenitalium]VEU60589.1 ABC-type multidrug/protein/lipid transport system ATPase component [Mycoplasmopsis bovigenitalium]